MGLVHWLAQNWKAAIVIGVVAAVLIRFGWAAGKD